ncbi:phage holin family protein [Psychroflexus maritimus]|uniref:Phage holin family protein n=1 Tax=Psychroflexus maritimus TaxID=2714865 RepID=A0A967DZF7_9FLAO|nr:phage holin family protein [Psychroflexus maritimus]NGZ89452.1 phage holin family protein [Psychroflexus maritimus]
MPFKLQDHVEHLTEDSKNYLEALVEYYKLDAYKKSAKASSALLRFIVVSGVFLLFFGFLSVGVAILLGDLLNQLYLGFFIVAAFNLLLVLFFATKGRKLIDRFVLTVFGEIFSSTEEENTNEN